MDIDMETDNEKTTEPFSEEENTLLDSLLGQVIKYGSEVHELKDIRYPYTLTGQLVSFDADGYAIVNFTLEGCNYHCTANATIELSTSNIDQACLILFNQGDITQPIITGLIQTPSPFNNELVDEDKPLVIHSETGILLKCGSSRIELSNDGTINIQGMHINSQAYGPNRIKGGSVKIN